MGHGHDHSSAKGKRLGLTILLNLGITIAQVIGGTLSGSLSLISDAAHNFSDVIALIISWIADKLAHKEYTIKQTFGYKRSEVIAAVINVSTIIVIAVNIFIEAIQRFNQPTEIVGSVVMWLAGLSIVINGLSVLIVKRDTKDNMNMRSAYLHLFSDMLTSIAVLVGGFIMYYFNIYWIDSIISIGISAFLLYSSFSLLIETLKVLMQFTPKEVDINQIKKDIESNSLVNNLHHVHAWKLTDKDIHFQAHLDFNKDIRLSEVNDILDDIKKTIHSRYNINHVTFEPEYLMCDNKVLIVDERH